MFKRGKNASDNASGASGASGEAKSKSGVKSGAASAFSNQSDTKPGSEETTLPSDQKTTAKGRGDLSSRAPISTPISSFDTRKPNVRTLSSAQSSSGAAAPANLHVGRGLKLEGKIQSCDSLVIEGNVQATIDSESLTITDTGEVTGEATVGNAEINGKFDGTLTVRGCLTINSTGRITGTVHYGELKVEQGGKIAGQIDSQDLKVEKPTAAAELASSTPLRDAASA